MKVSQGKNVLEAKRCTCKIKFKKDPRVTLIRTTLQKCPKNKLDIKNSLMFTL